MLKPPAIVGDLYMIMHLLILRVSTQKSDVI